MKRGTTAAFGALGAACALVPALAMWGFTVDDALVTVRYARNLAAGVGYRFDAAGPSTDGVTPLPYAFVLAPLAAGGASALEVLARAKALGVVAWVVAGAALGARVGREARGDGARAVHAAVALLTVALAFPVGAWAASGMETGLVTALVTWGAVWSSRPRRAAALAGAAAAFRPELVVWAVTLALALAAADRASRRARDLAACLALAVGPFVACAAIRLVAFGRPAPLAVLAKPSDLAHGGTYAVAAAVACLTPLLVLAPLALARAGGAARALAAAGAAHLGAVAAAGGDWMPYARLVVPVAPSLALAAFLAAPHARGWANGLRAAAAVAVGVALAARAAPAGRGVSRDRADLVARARPVLADARVVAALDVGWVSAATDARIVDLAGLTDPTIAALGGGHTSKRVDTSMLLDRGVDAVIVYAPPRVVEARLLGAELFAARFAAAEKLPLGDRGAFYTVYRRR